MAKLRKMLTDINADYLQELMRLVETQSVETITLWATNYAKENLLPLWYNQFEDDYRLDQAIGSAQKYIAKEIDLKEAKMDIIQVRDLARTLENTPIAQGIARAVDASCSAIHNPAGSLGIALYGALALAYNEAGTDAPWQTLENIAEKYCIEMIQALKNISKENEPNPAKIKWGC